MRVRDSLEIFMKQIAMLAIALLMTDTMQGAPVSTPAPAVIGIASVSYQGTGCPTGSVATSLAPDSQAMTMIFAQFGVDTSVRRGWPMRKVCNIELTMNGQPGWQYSIIAVDIRGYANLQAGAVGVQKIAYSFGRQNKRFVDRLRLVGPYDNNFANHADFGTSDSEWSPCSRVASFNRLMLKVAVNVRPRGGFTDEDGDIDGGKRDVVYPSGYMAVDAVDGGIVHRYQLTWRRCI